MPGRVASPNPISATKGAYWPNSSAQAPAHQHGQRGRRQLGGYRDHPGGCETGAENVDKRMGRQGLRERTPRRAAVQPLSKPWPLCSPSFGPGPRIRPGVRESLGTTPGTKSSMPPSSASFSSMPRAWYCGSRTISAIE